MSPGSKHNQGCPTYQAFFEQAQYAFFINSKDGFIHDCNEAASHLLGYTRDELIGTHFQNVLTPRKNVPVIPDAVDTVPAIVTCFTKDGRNLTCWYSAQILTSQGGTEWFGCILANISGVPGAESHFAGENALSNVVINSLPGIFYLFNTDGKFLRWNRDLEMLSGYASDQISHMHPLDFFDEDEHALIRERIAEVFAKGRSDVEAHLLTSDGRKIPHYFNGMAIEYENQPCLIGMGIDITRRIVAEQAIRESNERFNIVAMATNDNIWDWNLEENRVEREGKKLEVAMGYDPWHPEEVEQLWNANTHPEDLAKLLEKRKNIIKNSSCNYWEDEYRFRRSDGSYAFVYDRGYIIRNEVGRAVRMIGASQDITLRKMQEAELKEKNKELKRLSEYLQRVREEERKYMAREVHDELGQLASALKMDIDWITLKLADNTSLHKRLEHARKTVDVLINSVRKIAHSLRPSILDDFGLNEALRWQCAEIMKRNGVECRFTGEMDDTVLDLHTKTELFRIGQESLTNVLRHAQATTVNVRTYTEGGEWFLTISDNGKGFDTSLPTGTLGLVGLRERVLSMRGRLLIESNPGRGTLISVAIPIGTVK